MTAYDEIQNCINNNKSFVVQGGAGSGKTEILKQSLEYINNNYPIKKTVCITHTNLAADEIKSRVGNQHIVSTIHSFLNNFTKDYKKNIHKVIHKLFEIDLVHRQGIEHYGGDETKQKKCEHEKYKKCYGKYTSALYAVKGEQVGKVEGKRAYDNDPDTFNATLNTNITSLNEEMYKLVADKDPNNIGYNETRFNSFTDLTYGHDGLLDITYFLFDKYPLITKILRDKYDLIFIDEYQDTNRKIIDLFVNKYLEKNNTLIGLFGDSMQAIYEDGIGDVDCYVQNEILARIDKQDNFRSSEQVKELINKLRNDGLVQEIAFKKKVDGAVENISDRQGSAILYYSIYENKPHVRSSKEEKEQYYAKLDELILHAIEGEENYVQLKLTNKSIASEVGFEKLYGIFSDRYLEPQEYIDRHLDRLQFSELFELCNAYKPQGSASPNYNLVLSRLKKRGFSINKISDKTAIKEKFDTIIDSGKGAMETLDVAIEIGLLKKSDRHLRYIEQKNSLVNELQASDSYSQFKQLSQSGKNTFNKIKDDIPGLNEMDFKELERDFKKEMFYEGLYSDSLKFQEIMNYFRYLNEDTEFLTMHRTKGGERENVVVVLDEYFWRAYDFKSVFSEELDLEKKSKNQKLVYVACSRAKRNLKCVRLVADENEASDIAAFFELVVEV